MKGKLRIKNKTKFGSFILMSIIFIAMLTAIIGFATYPELYVTTWRKDLKEELANGNQIAIEYYNDKYVAKGKLLFGDKYIIEEEYLNLATVVGYDVSENGILLHTNDGNGYFIEK
jgi:hypothetical protein